jgi:hypothetical protein
MCQEIDLAMILVCALSNKNAGFMMHTFRGSLSISWKFLLPYSDHIYLYANLGVVINHQKGGD